MRWLGVHQEVPCSVGNHHVPRFHTVAELNEDYCCLDCAQQYNNRGRFEKYVDFSDDPEFGALGTCLILYSWAQQSSEDEFMSHDGMGYCGRFDNFLLYQDTQGFYEYEEFTTPQLAEKQFQSIYEDGMGASEDDAYIGTDRGRWTAYMDGKSLNIWPRNDGTIDRQRALARVRLEMIRTGYWPNVWEEYGYGVRLVKEV